MRSENRAGIPTADSRVATAHSEPITSIHPADLHGILRVRQGVFIIEQNCPYPDIDDVDIDPSTRHHWIAEDGVVVSTMRSYLDAEGVTHVGRVATHPASRGRGYSRRLMNEAIARLVADFPGFVIQIGAQAYLREWYETFGYRVSGDGYVEDGIPHFPMVLDVASVQGRASAGRE